MSTAVQLKGVPVREKPWLSVAGLRDIDDGLETERMTLDVRASDYEFLANLAAYRNALAKVQGKRLRKQWSRKSLGESFVAIQVDAMREQLAEMLKACGEIPDSDDAEAMERYAKRVLAWDAKTNSGK